MTDRSGNRGELFGLIPIAILFGYLYWHYPRSNEYLEVKCSYGVILDDDHNCISGSFTAGSTILVTSDKSVQKVLLKIEKNNGEWFGGNELYLSGCNIISEDQWECTDWKGNPGEYGSYYHRYGVYDGTYYRELIGGAPPDYYTSSIGGWRLMFYNIGVKLDKIYKIGWSDLLKTTR